MGWWNKSSLHCLKVFEKNISVSRPYNQPGFLNGFYTIQNSFTDFDNRLCQDLVVSRVFEWFLYINNSFTDFDNRLCQDLVVSRVFHWFLYINNSFTDFDNRLCARHTAKSKPKDTKTYSECKKTTSKVSWSFQHGPDWGRSVFIFDFWWT